MGDGDAAGQLGTAAASSSFSPRAEAHLPVDYENEDCDNLYGDVNVLPLSPSPALSSPPKTPSPGPAGRTPSPSPPLSPSPEPSSPPKTPSLGSTPSPSPPPRRSPAPEPRPGHEPEPQPKPSSPHPQYHPPRPPPPAALRHQVPQPQRAPRGDASISSSPPGTALYISELPWWATDAEVEAALAIVPHAAAALRGLFFYTDKFTGKSRGVCRADFLSPAVAAAAAAALHGRAFHGRSCVASLSRPPALNCLGHYANAEPVQSAPNTSRGRGATTATTVRGNVGPIFGDRPALAPLRQQSMAPRPHGLPFGGTMGGGGGYGGFPSMGHSNANVGTGTGMIGSAVAPHVNSAFLAASGMAMRGPGVWPDQAMGRGFWGEQPPWNFGGCQLPWQQPAPPMHAQQKHAYGDYGKGRGMRRGRPGWSDERSIGNVWCYPERRQSDHDGGDLYKEHDREERSRHQDHAPEKEKCVREKEREPERHWDERDRCRGNKRMYQEYTEDNDNDRRARVRAKSQSRNDGSDDNPRRCH